ncbi:MAG: flagellar hook-basal body complex protein FliE [Firmicutes bacterium]|jgi:flagellar hook-basal body complex protein FliE|nr:flagellar hook-basal body complex protein FliE [Bacillota bacterium]
MEAISGTLLAAPKTLSAGRTAASPEKQELSFGEMLQNALSGVNRLQKEADQAAMELLSGDTDNLHQVMLKVEEARLSLQLTVQVVNKLIQAYQDLSRMQI